ncbi:hypothetical protein ABIE33_007062 [Ensifer sp. 4252]
MRRVYNGLGRIVSASLKKQDAGVSAFCQSGGNDGTTGSGSTYYKVKIGWNLTMLWCRIFVSVYVMCVLIHGVTFVNWWAEIARNGRERYWLGDAIDLN